MSSQKLFSNRSVLHILKSFNGRGGIQICQFCGLANCLRETSLASILHQRQSLATLSEAAAATKAPVASTTSSSSLTTASVYRTESPPAVASNVMQKRGLISASSSITNKKSHKQSYNKTKEDFEYDADRRQKRENPPNNFSRRKCINYQQYRLSSTTSGNAIDWHNSVTNQLATEILVKRDASTQARTQVRESPNYHVHPSNQDSFRCSELEMVKCLPNELSPKPPVDKLLFGKEFTDHMFRVDWDAENGWNTPLISKVHHLQLHPAAKVFHYGLSAFEGAKAYRGYDNKIRFFRLDQNIKRLLQSTRRLALPEFDVDELMKCIHKLVELDQDWIPHNNPGRKQLTSLYLRPHIMGTEPSLGVAPSKKATLNVTLSPVGPYFKTGFKPVSLYADPEVVRAWPGGAGSSKLASNYAPTILPQRQAEVLGHQQVLWLFGDDEKLTEVGTMNIFVTYNNSENGKTHLVTPPLTDGLILPGITRRSILEMASQWKDIVCEERYLTIGDIQELIANGQMLEMFGSGTACIVCPISSINLKDGRKISIPSHNLEESSPSHAITQRILTTITDIQYGKTPHPWAQELGYL